MDDVKLKVSAGLEILRREMGKLRDETLKSTVGGEAGSGMRIFFNIVTEI